MKTHIVREAFNLDGVDYPRGSEITDRAIIARVRESHPGHVVAQHHDAPQPASEPLVLSQADEE